MRPLPRLDERVDREAVVEVVSAVQDLLRNREEFEQTCLDWKEKFEKGVKVEGVPIAVDALRRLVAAAVVEKDRWPAQRS